MAGEAREIQNDESWLTVDFEAGETSESERLYEPRGTAIITKEKRRI